MNRKWKLWLLRQKKQASDHKVSCCHLLCQQSYCTLAMTRIIIHWASAVIIIHQCKQMESLFMLSLYPSEASDCKTYHTDTSHWLRQWQKVANLHIQQLWSKIFTHFESNLWPPDDFKPTFHCLLALFVVSTNSWGEIQAVYLLNSPASR